MASEHPPDADSPLDFAGYRIPSEYGIFLKIGAVLIGLVILYFLLAWAKSIYTDWLWFDSLGFQSVFVKKLVTRIVLFIIGFLLFGALLGPNLYMAYRTSSGTVTLPMPPEAVTFFKKLIFWATLALAIMLSIIFGSILASRWEEVLLFTNSVSFGEVDPVFNKDISFYVFRQPLYNFLEGWLLGASILVMLTTIAMYFVNFSLRGVGFTLSAGLKIHVSIIAAIIMFIIASGHWLDRWELVLSSHGAVFGAAYADIHARKPALLILTLIASASGVLMLVNAYIKGLRLLIGAFALWAVLAIILGWAWPLLMQRFTVNPNEFVRESEFINRNIVFTRKGFGLDHIEEQFYAAEATVSESVIQANLQTVNNIRLWDHGPLSDVYRQLQLIRPYYDFQTVDVDRYFINGEYRQVLLAAREVAPDKLTDDSQTWTNRKFVYTHGIGVAMSPVTEFTPEGRPLFFAKDIPPDGVIRISDQSSLAPPDLVVSNPRIYYGETTTDPIIVNTKTDELDFQTEEGDLVRTKYFGTGGVKLSSFIKRLAFAWQLTDLNILISGEITGDSLIQYRRQIQERISTVAPFLILDQDPYIVAADDQLFWIQDAYTISDHFPYSDPVVEGGFNYMRNSVKITMDAFNGTLGFYIWDTTDPVIMAYSKIFPDLFLPQEAMPVSLQQHVRYPQDFFATQAQKYIKYHQQDSQNFYNNEDLWAVPQEKFGQSANLQDVQPYFIIMTLPGEETEEFVQLLPYTPNERENLIGWLAARSDGENYGKLVAFNFPKDRQVDGPAQVEARIDNNQAISEWFTLKCQEGSSCIRGNLLVIPIGDSLIYAEPVYIQADGVRFPELKRVILATADKVVMEDTLEEALASLTGFSATAQASPVNGEAAPSSEATPSETIQLELETITEAIDDIKENLSQLEETLERLKELTGGN